MLNALAQQIPTWFLATPEGRKISEAKRQADYTTRQEQGDKLVSLQRDRVASAEKLTQAIEPLRLAWEAAQRKTQAAGKKLDAAVNQREAVNRQNDFAQRALIRQLTASADPKIRAARDQMNRLWDEGHHQLARSGEEVIEGQFVNHGSAKRYFGNHSSIVRLLEAIKTARLKFDQLMFASPEDLDAAIAKVLAPVEHGWETVEEMAEVGTNFGSV